ncbi:hypothetical protein [Streptomyces sp. NPDC059176]
MRGRRDLGRGRTSGGRVLGWERLPPEDTERRTELLVDRLALL